MTDYFLYPEARNDLEEIWLYGLENYGINQADKYIAELENRFRWLAEKPLLGKKRNEIKKDCLSYLYGSHIIFYRQKEQDIEIARVLHQSMDISSHFDKSTF